MHVGLTLIPLIALLNLILDLLMDLLNSRHPLVSLNIHLLLVYGAKVKSTKWILTIYHLEGALVGGSTWGSTVGEFSMYK